MDLHLARPLVLAVLLAPRPASGQSVQIYSELQRIGPFGQVLAQDRSPEPREIISPAAARNGFISFHVAVSVPPGQTYFLFVQANPPDIIHAQLYKEQFRSYEGQWIPDTLFPAAIPAFGVIPDEQVSIPGQTTRDYLLDIWVPPDADPGRRVRVEVLLKYGTWYVAPMELRVTPAVIHPPPHAVPGPLPSLADPADAAAASALASHFAGLREWNAGEPASLREIFRRNAQQDMALANDGPDPALLLRAFSGIVDGRSRFPPGAEWYLRVRDLLISRPHP